MEDRFHNPVSAIATTDDNSFKEWQRRNRLRRDEGLAHPSQFIYWTHVIGLGFDSDLARYSATRKETDSYVAGVVGIIAFPFLGLPILCVRVFIRAFRRAYYGE